LFEQILAERPALHTDFAGGLTNWSITPELARFLFERTNASMQTLETGSGLSTVILTLRRARHLAVAPWREDLEAVKAYCRVKGLSLRRTRLVRGRSEVILPALHKSPLDLVLIDGRHAFPTPFIDWFYTADRLRVGGLMVVDDLNLPSCSILAEFLGQDPRWREEVRSETWGAFHKTAMGILDGEWIDQPWRRPAG